MFVKGDFSMKQVPRSKKPSFTSQDSGAGPVNQHKAIAMGKQGAVGTTKRPGIRSTGGGLKIKTKY